MPVYSDLVPSRVEANHSGVRVTYAHPHLPDSVFEMGWDQVDGIAVYALADGPGVDQYMSFDHDDGEFMEIHSGMIGWDQVVATLGEHLQLDVDSVEAVLGRIQIDQAPVPLLHRCR